MQVPSLRLVIWGFVRSIVLLGHTHREPGDEMKWETNSSHALLQPNHFTATNGTIRLKIVAGDFARDGEGGSLKRPQIIGLMPLV